jgi:hypothetical protein
MTLRTSLLPYRRISIAAVFLALAPGCGSDSGEPANMGASGSAGTSPGAGGAPGGGSPGSGGSSAGTPGNGGTPTPGGGGTPSPGNGGAPSPAGGSGGMPATGGSGGTVQPGTGGASAGGMSAGGGSATGGTGGASGNGGASGAAGSGGGANCAFPTTFAWNSSGSLAEPKSPSGHNFVSLKDFTAVRWNNQYVVYATVFDTNASWSGVTMSFTDWAQAASAPQTYLGNLPTGATVAPTLFFFTPKNIWVLTYQWGFKYATSTDPTKPSMWSSPKNLLSGDPTGGTGTGPIDQTVICDATNCYIFFAGDNGHIYRGSMPIGSFPGAFTNATSIMSDSTNNLFEAVQVYSIKGAGKYLMIVEAIGSGGRYFRAFTSTTLGGTFTALSGAATENTPFAGKKNVTFTGTAWTNDISHGDFVREDPSETQTIDPCNLQFLYQGRSPSSGGDYGKLPYRPGLLTFKK